ncbi:MAG: cytidine deaminase [Anaerolineaceae bacterium]
MTMEADLRQKLIEMAINARQWAYAPYSNYTVGAVLLTDSGKIYDGVNIENAAYPTGICAERVAIFKAVSEGERRFKSIVVATENGGSPCGSCRQVMAEFGLDTEVIIVDRLGKIVLETTVEKLLPDSFTNIQLV